MDLWAAWLMNFFITLAHITFLRKALSFTVRPWANIPSNAFILKTRRMAASEWLTLYASRKFSCICPVMLRLQKGYFSSASTEARNVARSSKELPRRFMRAKSQNPTPFSVTTTLSGVKSQSTAELGNDLRLRG